MFRLSTPVWIASRVVMATSLASVIVLLVAAWQAYGRWTWARRSLEAEGLVVPSHLVNRVRFTTAEGEIILFSAPMRFRGPAFQAGERVRVLYDPDEPQRASIAAAGHFWRVPLTTAGIAVPFLLADAAAFVYAAYANRRAKRIRAKNRPVQARIVWMGVSKWARRTRYLRFWQVTAEWTSPETGTLRRTNSRLLTFDPSRSFSIGDTVRVYADRKHSVMVLPGVAEGA